MDDLIEARWATISLFYFKLSPIYSIVKEWHCQGSPKTWKGKEIQKLKASIESIVFQMMINCFNNKPQTARVIHWWFWGLLQSVCWSPFSECNITSRNLNWNISYMRRTFAVSPWSCPITVLCGVFITQPTSLCLVALILVYLKVTRINYL